MARQDPWYTPGQPASAGDTWPLEDPYGEPGPGLAGQQDQQPAVPGSGSQGGGFVPAASYRMRRSPARPPAPRKARLARNTPLLPGQVLIAAALAGIAVGAGIAATAGQPAIRLAPADNPAATSQYTPTAGPATTPSPAASSAPPTPNPSPSAGAAGLPAISMAAAERVLASYWAANNRANKARSDTLLARIEVGASYQMDAGAYRAGRAAGPASGYTPVTAQNSVLWIPRQPAGTYPRWFAARVTYMGEGAGYLVFTQPRAGAPWKNVLEPYLLHGTGPGPFVTTGTDGYAAQADPDAAGLAVTPAQIEAQTAASFDGTAAAVGNPGNLADLRDEAYFAAHLPPGTYRHRQRTRTARDTAPATPADEPAPAPGALLTIEEVIAELRVSRAAFYRWRRRGTGPAEVRLPGGGVRIRRSALQAWLRRLEHPQQEDTPA